MELIYKGETIKDQTRTSNLTQKQTFKADTYGTGWYKVKVTAENRKNKDGMGKSNKCKRWTDSASN